MKTCFRNGVLFQAGVWRRFRLFGVFFAFGLILSGTLGLLFSCVSRTVPDTRFGDSSALSSPLLAGAPVDPENFTFAFVGDTHVGEDTTRLRRILNSARMDGDGFVSLLGDIVDEGKRESFVAVRAALSDYGFVNLFLPVIGNHDVFDEGWKYYKELLGPSHYTVDYANSRFIALDTADGTVDRTQFEWLEGEFKKSRPKNTFILSHYLPVIPGQRTYLKLSNEEEALRLMGLVQTYGVRAWLGAHYHSYISSSHQGVQYVVAGGAGGRRMDPVKDFFYVQARVSGETVTYTMKTVE